MGVPLSRRERVRVRAGYCSAGTNETFDCNPKRKRGNALRPCSRFGLLHFRVQYSVQDLVL